MAALKNMIKRGFFFASEEEESLNIYTRHNLDGTSYKQVVLPDSRKTAMVRQSNSRDHNQARLLSTDDNRHGMAILSFCTMLNGRKASLYDIEELSPDDEMSLLKAYLSLNDKDWKALVIYLETDIYNNIISSL